MSRSIEPPPLPKHSFPNSKRRVFSGSGSSSHFMDSDVIEIPSPPLRQPSNLMNQKEAILHDVIDIDNDDDSTDLVLVGEKVGKNDKGKTIEGVHDGFAAEFVDLSDCIFMENFDPASRIDSSNDLDLVSHNLINGDGDGSDLSYDDDDYTDPFSDDYMDVDKYTLLQAHFDNVDIPPGIEAPIPWLPDTTISQVTDSSQPLWSLELADSEVHGSSVGSSSLQIKMDAIDHLSGVELSSPQLLSQAAQPAPSKKKSAASQRRGCKLKLSLGADSSEAEKFLGSFKSKKKPNVFGASTNHGFIHSESVNLPPAGEPPNWAQFKSAKKAARSSCPYPSNFTGPVDGSFHPPPIELPNPWWKSAMKAAGSSSSYHSNFVGPVDGSFHPPAIESPNPWWKSPLNFKPFPNYTANSGFFNPSVHLHGPPEQVFDNTWVHSAARDGSNGTTADSTIVTISDEVRDEILRKFQNFKQFDTVEDTSDHYFFRNNCSMKQHPKNWAKRIQEEWKMLEKDLPDSIFVRVYESRMDLLRAVIIGAEGTPYHDGVFFFDIFFPSGYPNVPPQVHYHSGGLRLNPNLYNCGKVCLSLLNTWSGNENERWLPGVSTILQVLVSIQGLILNTKPYFNEPGYAHMNGSASGEMKSLLYNEETFILSLRTMVYMIRRPPKNFEDFVVGHFCIRGHDILVACKAYMDGAQVGCLVKGGVQDVDEGDRSCSKQFKEALPLIVNLLVREFTQIGAKDCEKFLSPSTTEDKSLAELPDAVTRTVI